MNYILECMDETGKLSEIIYDNLNNSFMIVDATDEDLLLVAEQKEYVQNNFPKNKLNRKITRVSNDTPGIKTKDIHNLKILLGLDCNYNCSYCKQKEFKQQDTSNEDLDKFLSLLQYNIEPNVKKIEFWGGEPLLYWEKIKYLLPKLREIFIDVEFGMVTNGSLITEEIIDYIIEYDIGMAISHDGPGQYLRGDDPTENESMYRLWKILVDNRTDFKRFSFNSVLTPKNNNINNIIGWFKNKFGDNVVVNFEGIVNHYEGYFERFTDEQIFNLKMYIYDSIIDGSVSIIPSHYMKLVDTVHSILLNKTSDNLGQKCGMDKPNQIAIDLYGNVMTCHNVGAIGKHHIGHISDLDNVKLNTSLHWSYRENCKNCLVLHVCKGSCMYLEGDEFTDTCINEYHYALPFLFGAIWNITGKTVIGFRQH